MAYEKKTVQEYIAETEDETVEGFNDNQETRIQAGFDATKIESGSNSNGTWTKFPDGTMICKHLINIDVSIFAFNAATWELPQEFIDTNYAVSYSRNLTQVRNVDEMRALGSIVSSTTSTTFVAFGVGNPLSVSKIFVLSVFAIGRWK